MTKHKLSPKSWDELKPFLTPERILRTELTAAKRTNTLRIVLQDVHNPHNISACLRSMEAFGITSAHIVSKEGFKPSTVARGVHKWIEIHTHSSIEECASSLLSEGFEIFAAMPDQNSVTLENLPFGKSKIALLFGNEHSGVSAEWNPYLKGAFTIPMVGMVESLNISVCCAIASYVATKRTKEILGEAQYYLKDSEKKNLLDQWAQKS
jgi:tRNA (guanosine-2'-O-)-methyltransferase